ncbi:PA0069 family radical SAM protein [Chryseolinea lacunae]|uniref:PA0069 family radical SAM protein n=1 Tax=Chryseolinea lacunae TaxID=2801331 RepID=A0ABS1KQS0_9BACT|nr:PA0069 family radical SAM protein [Chryseolinea lacunae]MBL0741828.1 PA0069 family radical SAM protein [Chryseolinea lacunae]
MDEEEYFKGRGAQIKTGNKFLKAQYVEEHIEGLDEPLLTAPTTQLFYETPKKIVNKVTSPDLGMAYSTNPYQGCEHGCIYCYARNSHEYWGFSAGLDFESKIVVKKNAASLLEKFLLNPNWEPVPISVSGNTDCYQPIEKKLEITRSMLKVFAQYRHPLGMITKNSLVLRDIDLLTDLAKDNLVHVYISITTLDESLRRVMEPRTASALKRLQTVEALAKAGVPVGVMNAPIIPGLNHHEIPAVLKAAADHGAQTVGMTIVRLNGSIGQIFEDWLRKNFPDRFEKVWNQICSMHGGQVNDSQFGRRMSGEGNFAEAIHQLFRTSKAKYFKDRRMPPIDLTKFRKGGNLSLF